VFDNDTVLYAWFSELNENMNFDFLCFFTVYLAVFVVAIMYRRMTDDIKLERVWKKPWPDRYYSGIFL
jgi:hypothetical protein